MRRRYRSSPPLKISKEKIRKKVIWSCLSEGLREETVVEELRGHPRVMTQDPWNNVEPKSRKEIPRLKENYKDFSEIRKYQNVSKSVMISEPVVFPLPSENSPTALK